MKQLPPLRELSMLSLSAREEAARRVALQEAAAEQQLELLIRPTHVVCVSVKTLRLSQLRVVMSQPVREETQ